MSGCGRVEYEASMAPPFFTCVADSGPFPRPGTAELCSCSVRIKRSGQQCRWVSVGVTSSPTD